ncbi:hypothetical protein TNCV_1363771 [Trichonephila clavipes]|uniref:Uncharacterized protein n=1 Tax=Trichonephila clavipes TaxID=2585209 RepID=A0A8X6RUQ9_TRICX|nr:hypothetical protein TNCV_1363771 [Trichonephila clavipes]
MRSFQSREGKNHRDERERDGSWVVSSANSSSSSPFLFECEELLGPQWIDESSFTWRPGSGSTRQTSRREDHPII